MAKPAQPRASLVEFAGRELLLDATGVVFDIASATLVVADLHLEKAEAFARRGQLLPPYDSLATLRRLAEVAAQYRPRRLVLAGDSFHRADSALAMGSPESSLVDELEAATELIWLSGNHDPARPSGLPGEQAEQLTIGGLTLRHQPGAGETPELFGHFHPVARLPTRAGARRRKCFVLSPRRLLLPAFGILTGGLDVAEPAIAGLFPETGTTVHLLLADTVCAVPLAALLR